MKKMLIIIIAAITITMLCVYENFSALPYENTAAEKLASFDFKELEASYVNISVCYEATDGFVATTSINSTANGNSFQEWTRNKWARWIRRRAQACVGKRKVARVKSVCIYFSIGGIHGESYKLEMTDTQENGFNRLIRYQPNMAESRLNRQQSEQITGTASVIRVAKQIPEENYSTAKSDLPECIASKYTPSPPVQ